MNYFLIAFVCALGTEAEDSSGPDGLLDIFDALKKQLDAQKAENEALKVEIRNLNAKTRLRRIPNRGQPGSSSDYRPGYSAQKAFSNYGSYWRNQDNQFPAVIYTKLEKKYRLAKITFSIVYTQANLKVVGSDDCEPGTWTPLYKVRNLNVKNQFQYVEWDIPAFDGRRESFSCYGLKWDKKTEKYTYPEGTGHVGVGSIAMWEEIDDDDDEYW